MPRLTCPPRGSPTPPSTTPAPAPGAWSPPRAPSGAPGRQAPWRAASAPPRSPSASPPRLHGRRRHTTDEQAAACLPSQAATAAQRARQARRAPRGRRAGAWPSALLWVVSNHCQPWPGAGGAHAPPPQDWQDGEQHFTGSRRQRHSTQLRCTAQVHECATGSAAHTQSMQRAKTREGHPPCLPARLPLAALNSSTLAWLSSMPRWEVCTTGRGHAARPPWQAAGRSVR